MTLDSLSVDVLHTRESVSILRENLLAKEKELIEALKLWRKERGISQTDLANKFGISKAYLSDIERHRRGVSQNILEKIYELK